MTQIARRSSALFMILVLSSACRGAAPTSPTQPTPRPTPAVSPVPVGTARIFTFEHALFSAVTDYTKTSRFVLYDNGTFALQYRTCMCGGEYLGRYTETRGVITFEWDGWSTAGPWGASGTLEGDTLTVRYNSIMQLTDFEDAAYLKTP